MDLHIEESLLHKVSQGDPDATYTYFTQVWDIVPNDFAKLPAALTQQIEQLATLGDPKNPAYAYAVFTLSYIDYFKGNFERSLERCTQAESLFAVLDDADGVAIARIIKGGNYRSLGAIDLAIRYQLEAYRQLRQNHRFALFEIATGHQLAELYAETGNYAESLRLSEEALQLAKARGSRLFYARLHNGIAGVHLRMGDRPSALHHLFLALQCCIEGKFDTITARVFTDLGSYYLSGNDFEKSRDYNQRAYAIRERLGLRAAQVSNLINLGETDLRAGRTTQAIATLQTALKQSEQLNLQSRIYQVALMLSGIYESLGDTAESLRYYKYHHRVLEAINHEDIEKKVRNIKTILEAEQTQRENEVIKAQKLEIEAEKKRSDDLLLNILPPGIAEELKATGEAEARFYNNVSVLFTDFKGFTTVAERMTARELVAELHACFKAFDDIMERHGIEKIKTVGDAYLAVCGLPGPDAHHAVKMVAAACDIRDFMAARRQALGEATFAIRIGIHSGSVVAGIVGRKKFAFDIWGDTVNTAARMEQNSEAGRINISEATYGLVADRYTCTCRGEIAAKNKGSLRMYFVEA